MTLNYNVSTVELILFAFFVGVALGGGGAVVVVEWFAHRRAELVLFQKRRDALARWLAARRTLTRAAAGFVAAERAIGAAGSSGKGRFLRSKEALRARDRWCDAMTDLERGEAEVLAWCGDGAARRQLQQVGRPDPRLISAALRGGEESFHRLRDHLRVLDRDALAVAEDEWTNGELRTAWLAPWLGLPNRMGHLTRTLIDRWSRR